MHILTEKITEYGTSVWMATYTSSTEHAAYQGHGMTEKNAVVDLLLRTLNDTNTTRDKEDLVSKTLSAWSNLGCGILEQDVGMLQKSVELNLKAASTGMKTPKISRETAAHYSGMVAAYKQVMTHLNNRPSAEPKKITEQVHD